MFPLLVFAALVWSSVLGDVNLAADTTECLFVCGEQPLKKVAGANKNVQLLQNPAEAGRRKIELCRAEPLHCVTFLVWIRRE